MAARQTFGDLVRERRAARNRTQEEIADAVGIRAGYLSRIERGKVPPPSDRVCRRLARALDLAPGELVRSAHMERLPADMRKLVSFQEDLRQAELWIQEELARRSQSLPADLAVTTVAIEGTGRLRPRRIEWPNLRRQATASERKA